MNSGTLELNSGTLEPTMQIEVLPPDHTATPATRQPVPRLSLRHVPALAGYLGLILAVGVGVLVLAAIMFVFEFVAAAALLLLVVLGIAILVATEMAKRKKGRAGQQ
jgi:hypothetical protein